MQPNFSIRICCEQKIVHSLSRRARPILLRPILFFSVSFRRLVLSSFGGCTFDSLAFGITIPRFSVSMSMPTCVCVCVSGAPHTMATRHFELPFSMRDAFRPHLALTARPIDTRPLIMCRWSFFFPFVLRVHCTSVCVYAAEMKSKPALVPRCSVAADPQAQI